MVSSNKKNAAALGYTPDSDRAPRVLATGQGSMALRIEHIARAQSIPVVVDPDMSALLSALPAGQEIPENLYRAVASLLGMVFKINQERKG